MASAGQAQAHSSHPMHFSSPSAHRFSWCLPWKRGAVGRLTSGYSTVGTFVNMVWKVTPNPFTGLSHSSTGNLLTLVVAFGSGGRGRPRWFGEHAAAIVLCCGAPGTRRRTGPREPCARSPHAGGPPRHVHDAHGGARRRRRGAWRP